MVSFDSYIPALTAGFAGWEPFIDLDDVTAVPFPFIQEHGHEHSPSIITIGLSKIECLFQSRHLFSQPLCIYKSKKNLPVRLFYIKSFFYH